MNERNLDKLIQGNRRMREDDAPLPDAESLAALVGDGPVSSAQRSAARVAESARNAQLYRFARDLQPISEQLSRDLRAQFANAAAPAGHRFGHRLAHHYVQARVWRWTATAAAASLALVAGLWAVHRYDHRQPQLAAVAAAGHKAVPDRIFAAFNDHAVAVGGARHPDLIFRSNFRAQTDMDRKRNEG